MNYPVESFNLLMRCRFCHPITLVMACKGRHNLSNNCASVDCVLWNSITHRNMVLPLFSLVWIFLNSLWVICYGRCVASGRCKNYFEEKCVIHSQPIFLILLYFFNVRLGTQCFPGKCWKNVFMIRYFFSFWKDFYRQYLAASKLSM